MLKKVKRDRFDDHKSTSSDVQAVLDGAARIDQFMRRLAPSSRAQPDWTQLRGYLDELARVYKVSWRWDPYTSEGSYRPVGNVPYRIDDRQVDQTLKRIETDSDRFRRNLDSALDASRFDGSREEDNINSFVKDFYDATKRLRDHFKDHKATSADVQNVLDRAARIDDFMTRRSRITSRAQNDWYRVKTDLDQLANVYSVSWRWR